MRLTVTFTLAALSVVALPAAAAAQDDTPVCSEGYALVLSAGGPLCVNPVYLDGTWADDPAECLWGYYQGSCASEPEPRVDLGVAAYTYQMDPADVAVPVVVVEPAVGWLTPVELALGDLRAVR